MFAKRAAFATTLVGLAFAAGCTTTKSSNTARTGVEQLLISNSVDRALDKVSFQSLAGRNVFLNEKYIDCVDKNYVIASLRHRILREGARLVGKPEEADIVLEMRSGAVGTDTSESFVGIPEIALPGVVALPEIRLLTRSAQKGTAKLGLVAYDAKTMQVLGDGGMTLAQSDDNNWYVMGIGPFQNGSVRKEVRRSSDRLVTQRWFEPATQVADRPQEKSPAEPSPFRMTSGEVRESETPPF